MDKRICVFDLDGTLNYTDARLSAEFLKLSKMGVEFVVSTGRSNNYVINTFIKNNILPPRYIIADNGASIYDTIHRLYLRKVPLSVEKRKAVIEKYLQLGGKINDIRYSDGDKLFAVDDILVRNFYAKEKTVTYYNKEDIIAELLRQDTDVTKLTLVAKRKLMNELVGFIEENHIKCFPDGGDTRFPEKSFNNYRLDITDGETSKGDGIRFLVNHLGIKSFMCIGNGENDFSMFKYAIDTSNQAIIVRNYKNGKIFRESEELVKKVKAYADKNGKNENLIIATYPANGLIGSIEEKRYNRQKSKAFINGLKVNIKGNQIRSQKKSIIKSQDRLR